MVHIARQLRVRRCIGDRARIFHVQERGEAPPPLVTEGLSFGWRESGSSETFYEGQWRPVTPGRMVCVLPDHAVRKRGQCEVSRHRVLVVDPAHVEEALETLEARGPHPAFYVERPSQRATLGALLTLEGGDEELHAETLLAQLLDEHFGGPNRRAPRAPARMRAVRELLRDRCAESLTMDDLVEASGLDRYRLIRSFKRAHGVTPFHYLRLVRLARARRLLHTGQRATAVALATGFSDQSHLTRSFGRVYGITPAAYQREGGALVRGAEDDGE